MKERESTSTCDSRHDRRRCSRTCCCVLNGVVRMKLGVLFSTVVSGLLPLLLLLDAGPTHALDICKYNFFNSI